MSERRKTASVMDGQRAKLERLAMPVALRLSRRMMVESVKAWKAGHDPVQPIRDHFARLTPTVEQGLSTSYLRSRLTTTLRARSAIKGLGFSTAFSEAQDYLKRRMELTDREVKALTEKFGTTAARATTEASRVLETKVQKAVLSSLTKGLTTEDGTLAIRRAFGAAGADVQNPALFETLFRTQMQVAYSAGQWEANKQPFIDEVLWGYEYLTVDDDRRTELCESLDGIKRKKNDVFWLTYWPPNHYNCRAEAVEIYTSDSDKRQSRIPTSIEPIEGFDFNFAEILQ